MHHDYYFESQDEFYSYLMDNNNHVTEIWLKIYKINAKVKCISYKEATDVALCFGWVEGVRKNLDFYSYHIKFTPRKPNGIWSKLNIQRAEELIELELIQPAGLKVFENRNIEKSNLYSYERENIKLDEKSEIEFKVNEAAWEFFQAQSNSYKRACTWWVIQSKREETRIKRLSQLIEDSSNGLQLYSYRKWNKK